MEAPRLGALIALIVFLATGMGHAADAVAESMFRSAIAKMEEGKFAEACPLLEASFAREQRSGTLVMLANCHENVGKTATAWATYREAASLARKEERPHIAVKAESLAKPLESKLSKLTVIVAHRLVGLEVRVDDRVVPPATFDVPFAVDPGSHRVDARAPGHAPWSMDVVVGTHADRTEVRVPGLTPVAAPAPIPEPAQPTPVITPAPERDLAPKPKEVDVEVPVSVWILGALTIASAAAAVGFGIDQQIVSDELDARCGGVERDACEPGYDFDAARDREIRDLGLTVGLGVAAGLGAAATTAIAVVALLDAEDDPDVSLALGSQMRVRVRW